MNTREILRHKIRELREEQHLTQADMAEKLGLSVTGYAKIERGETNVKAERLQQIAHIFNIGVQELMTPKEDAVIVFNNSNDNFSNSTHFSLAFGNLALEGEIRHFRDLVEAKNELLNSREREIEVLKQQVETLKKYISKLESE